MDKKEEKKRRGVWRDHRNLRDPLQDIDISLGNPGNLNTRCAGETEKVGKLIYPDQITLVGQIQPTKGK